jgi:hypothetical protein
MANMITHRLYIGNKSTGIVIAPDDRYPSMYRVHWPDRPPSDIVNLTRAKDAAELWATQNSPSKDRTLCSWVCSQTTRADKGAR